MKFLYVWRYRLCRWLLRHTRYPQTVDEYLAIYPQYRSSLARTMNSLYFYVPRFLISSELYHDMECAGEPELQVVVYITSEQFEYCWTCVDKFLDDINIQPPVHITCEMTQEKEKMP